jgi:hypothetical protein
MPMVARHFISMCTGKSQCMGEIPKGNLVCKGMEKLQDLDVYLQNFMI